MNKPFVVITCCVVVLLVVVNIIGLGVYVFIMVWDCFSLTFHGLVYQIVVGVVCVGEICDMTVAFRVMILLLRSVRRLV